MNYLQEELNSLIKQDDLIFHFLQDSAMDGLWYWDLENQENEWMNDRFWKTLGYDPTEMPHKSAAWQNIINKDDLATVLDNFNKHFIDPNYPYDQVVRYQHADGHTVWIRCKGLIIRDINNKPFRMLGAHTDITKQKKSELDLQKRLNRYNQIIDGANLATWEWDILSGGLILNENWAELLGYHLEEFKDNHISFWVDKAHSEDVAVANRLIVDHFKNRSSSFECEMRLKNKDGGWVWTLCKGKVIKRNENGLAILMTGYHQDISGRKESEQALKRYKEFLDRTNEVARIGTWEVDLINGFVHWSKVTRQIHEVHDDFIPDVATGIDFYKLGESKNRIIRVFTKAIEDGIPFDEELEIITAKNNKKWVRSIGIPVQENGRVTSIYGVFQDITALKNALQEAELLLKVKNEKNERLINFSHIVSHNLRSHSVNLSMLVELIDKKYPDSTQNEFFQMLRESTRNLSETIEHLNEVASMNMSTAEGMERFSLEPFIEKAIANVKPSLIECNGEITILGDVNLEVQIIPAYLDSVLLNLLTNAIKYRSDERTLKIQINTYNENNQVVVSVADNGLGIDLDKHGHKLFGMYKIFHEHKDSRGIGLFISKSQMEAMGGQISADSKIGEGSEFKIFLKE